MKWVDELLGSWRGTAEPSAPLIWGFAAACLAASTLIRWGISSLRPDITFTPYFPAVLFATLLGGFRAGVATTIAGACLGYIVHFGDAPSGGAKVALLLIYAAVCALIIWALTHYRTVVGHYRQIADKLATEESYRKLVVDELQHRLKNKVSTVHAVVRQALRAYPEAWERIDGRIRALSATDDLIARTDERGCDLKALLMSELEPYGHVRYTLTGDDVLLPPKLAVSMALVFHELATNAAKYGSFSAPEGLLNVSWELRADRLNVLWDETGGPAVSPPASEGFGIRLLDAALRAFDGHTQRQFLPSGLRCMIDCRIPNDQSVDLSRSSG
ncbi:sensor histidine kinase [Bradyrhizobium prioriisuperbiae]|uniref:sensor histidine kinase n=1 Tax=Bradyrhizobium prioriisuperbiae TaxID=2854389 RepID=UPI0028F0CBC3|nr:HWE histidine kinase domain-containing protein [Bradyrhizobium prioritasuperba]